MDDIRNHLRLVAGVSKPESKADVVVNETSFRCIRNMTKVLGFFVDIVLGDVAAAVLAKRSPPPAPEK